MAKATYKIILRDKRGHFSKIGRAVTYEIFYGKKRLTKKTLFHKRYRLVKQKNKYLENLIVQIEREKNRILKQAQLKRASLKLKKELSRKRQDKLKLLRYKKQVNALKKAHNSEVIRKVKISERMKVLKNEKSSGKSLVKDVKKKAKEKTLEETVKFLHGQILDFDRIREEAPRNYPGAEIEKYVLVTPFKPQDGIYKKEFINKKIATTAGDFDTGILSYKLENPLPLSTTNYEEELKKIFYTFAPHILDFYKETKEFMKMYTLNIRFLSLNLIAEAIDEKYDIHNKDKTQGISLARQVINSEQQLMELLNQTIKKLNGTNEPGTIKIRTRNYLEDEHVIHITGFFIEGVFKDGGRSAYEQNREKL